MKVKHERRYGFDCGTMGWSLLLLAFLIQPCPTPATRCQPIELDMCKAMPYNLTKMPNLLHHSTQGNANLALEPYQQLVDTGCSRHLVFFLCSVFAPMCNDHFRQEAIPPCRDVCRKARADCEPVMLRYNVSWPRQLDCGQFPQFDRGVCISPDAIISGPVPGEYKLFLFSWYIDPHLSGQLRSFS